MLPAIEQITKNKKQQSGKNSPKRPQSPKSKRSNSPRRNKLSPKRRDETIRLSAQSREGRHRLAKQAEI